jgi:hypothetical protein
MYEQHPNGEEQRIEGVLEPLRPQAANHSVKGELIIGFDLETTGIDEDALITVACVWSPCGIRVSCFHGEDFTPVLDLLDAAKYIYTFNGISFDLPRLAKKCGRDMAPWVLKTVDPLFMMKGVIGFSACMKLNDLLIANGFEPKSGSGLAAIRYWHEGNLEALSSYCMDDARLTYELCAVPSILWGKWRVHLRDARAVSFV